MSTHFDHHDAQLLRALGFEAKHQPASWQDIGGPENGPRLIGGPACTHWTRTADDGKTVDVVTVCQGEWMHDVDPIFLWDEMYEGWEACNGTMDWAQNDDGRWVKLVPIGQDTDLIRTHQDSNGVLRALHKVVCPHTSAEAVHVTKLAQPVMPEDVPPTPQTVLVDRPRKSRKANGRQKNNQPAPNHWVDDLML